MQNILDGIDNLAFFLNFFHDDFYLTQLNPTPTISVSPSYFKFLNSNANPRRLVPYQRNFQPYYISKNISNPHFLYSAEDQQFGVSQSSFSQQYVNYEPQFASPSVPTMLNQQILFGDDDLPVCFMPMSQISIQNQGSPSERVKEKSDINNVRFFGFI